MRVKLMGLAVALISIVFTMAVLEVIVRIAAPQNSQFFDDSSIRKSAWEYKPGSFHASYIGVPVRINNIGLRGPDVALPKPDGVYRIVALGDSVTFGYGVREEETFAAVLQAQLNATPGAGKRYEVINAGMPGIGLDYYKYSMSRIIDKLDADAVLLCLIMNDIAEYRNPLSEPPQPRTQRRFDSFFMKYSHLYQLLYVRLKSVLYGFGVLDINTVLGYDFLAVAPASPEQDAAWKGSFAVIDDIRKVAETRSTKLSLVVFPIEPQLSADRLKLFQQRFRLKLGDEAIEGNAQRKIADYASRNKLSMIDLLPAFKAASSQNLFLRNLSISLDPVHPSVAGHNVAGEAIGKALTAEDLLRR